MSVETSSVVKNTSASIMCWCSEGARHFSYHGELRKSGHKILAAADGWPLQPVRRGDRPRGTATFRQHTYHCQGAGRRGQRRHPPLAPPAQQLCGVC